MLTWILAALLGWLAGVIINYISDVLPSRRQLAKPSCLYCDNRYPWINYFVWPRRCPQCKQSRAWRSWVVELFTILATLWLWQNPPLRIGFAAGYALLIYFGIVIVIDIEHRLILHWVSLFGAVLSLLLGVYIRGWQATLFGGLAGFGIMFSLYFLGILFVRFINRRRMRTSEGEALGFGDVILGGVLGLLLGWPAIVLGLVMAFLLGGIFSLLYLLAMIFFGRYRSFSAIPYGPFLIAGAAGLIFFRQFVLSFLGQ
jgi:prepilin signal peptidase PulO-like enzyme (type II secretory pathway)